MMDNDTIWDILFDLMFVYLNYISFNPWRKICFRAIYEFHVAALEKSGEEVGLDKLASPLS